MSTPLTELARTEMILREQLARVHASERREGGERRRQVLAHMVERLPWLAAASEVLPTRATARAFVAELFSKPRSVARLEASIAALAARTVNMRARRRRQLRIKELDELLAATRDRHAGLPEEQERVLPTEQREGRKRGLTVLARSFAALRRRSAPSAKPQRKEGSKRGGSLFDAVRHEQALGELFPKETRSAWEASSARRDARTETRRLPNLSASHAIDGSMKDLPERDWGPPPAVRFPMPAKKDERRSDLIVAGMGVALGLVCALFPWYIFFNQDQFGVQAIRFGGQGSNAGRAIVQARPGDSDPPVEQQIPDAALDLLATGTLQVKPEATDNPPGLDQQPFPAAGAEFRLVHVANGRAMIEDDAGLWIVQKGSVLPDSSVVKSIEMRKGRWVLITSTDRVLEVSK